MATSFDDFVNQQHTMAGDTERSVDWPRQLDEWKRFLEQFNDLVKEFLREYIEQGKMRIEYVAKQIHEQYIGRYEVQAISIVIGNNKVYLDPIGTNLIAAKGRVDMNGPSGTVRFVLVPKDSNAPAIRVRIHDGVGPIHDEVPQEVTEWTWKISTPPPQIRYIELEEELFRDAVMEVVNG